MTQYLASGTVSTENLFISPTKLTGYFNLSLSGTWNATLTVQRSFDLGATWLDVKTWTAATSGIGGCGYFGGGGNARNTAGAGSAAGNYGAGGGGALSLSSTGAAIGGAGSIGLIIAWEFA